jgi:hypothetical protein
MSAHAAASAAVAAEQHDLSARGTGGVAARNLRECVCSQSALAAASTPLTPLVPACVARRRPSYDLNQMPGPWRAAKPVVGNILECLRPDFHRVLLKCVGCCETEGRGGCRRVGR